MSESPPENPYSSPEVVPAPSRQVSANTNFWPPALVPRWWEWSLYVLLVVVMGPLAWSIFSLIDQFGGLHDVGMTFPGEVLRTLISVTGFWLGLVALRVWWWKSLPEGLAPGHTLLLANWFSTVILLGTVAAVSASVHFVVMVAPDKSTALLDATFRVSSVSNVVGNLGMCAILLWFMPRKGLWFTVTCGYVILAIISSLRTLELLDLGGDDGQFGGWSSMVSEVLLIAWLLVMFSFLALALHERWRGIHRDWLHWAGLVFWIAHPVNVMLRIIFRDLG